MNQLKFIKLQKQLIKFLAAGLVQPSKALDGGVSVVSEEAR